VQLQNQDTFRQLLSGTFYASKAYSATPVPGDEPCTWVQLKLCFAEVSAHVEIPQVKDLILPDLVF